MENKKTVKDSELVQNYIDYIVKNNVNYYDENAYYLGAHYEFNGLDVQNLKNPLFDSSNDTSTTSTRQKV